MKVNTFGRPPPPYPSHGFPQTRWSLLVYFPFSSFFSCLRSLSLTPCFPSDPPTLSHPIRRLGPWWVCVCVCAVTGGIVLSGTEPRFTLYLLRRYSHWSLWMEKPSAGLVIGGCCWSPLPRLVCVCVCVFTGCPVHVYPIVPLLCEKVTPPFCFEPEGTKKESTEYILG